MQLWLMHFNIVSASKDEDSLSNILSRKSLPVTVMIPEDSNIHFRLHRSQQNNHTLGVLTISEVYEETYFLANAISSGINFDFPNVDDDTTYYIQMSR